MHAAPLCLIWGADVAAMVVAFSRLCAAACGIVGEYWWASEHLYIWRVGTKPACLNAGFLEPRWTGLWVSHVVGEPCLPEGACSRTYMLLH